MSKTEEGRLFVKKYLNFPNENNQLNTMFIYAQNYEKMPESNFNITITQTYVGSRSLNLSDKSILLILFTIGCLFCTVSIGTFIYVRR